MVSEKTRSFMSPSALFRPRTGHAELIHGDSRSLEFAKVVRTEISSLIAQRDYPCVPAILSEKNNDFLIGTYSHFGSATSAQDLYRDLALFKDECALRAKPFFSFWAVFKDELSLNEAQFENHLWTQLSALSSCESPSIPWDPNFSSNPADKNFCLSLHGKAYFVVGLHQNSSRQARRFPWPTLIFNMYHQFQDLMDDGKFQPIVETNRKREMRYQGTLNPMVEEHGEQWESIQFSGQKNSSQWKCPFHRK